MKKILTAVATVAALSANTAVAEESFELQTKGFLTWYAGFAKQNDTVYTKGGSNTPIALTDGTGRLSGYDKASLVTDGEVDFVGTYKFNDSNDNKLSFFMSIDIIRDKVNVDLSYFKWDSKAGRFIVGNSKNVSNMMAVTSPDVGTLGIQDTYATNLIALPYGFALNPATYSIIDNDTAKVSYISPEMGLAPLNLNKPNKYGSIQFGMTVMPSDAGLSAGDAYYVSNKTRLKYGANVAVLYTKDFGKNVLSVSANYAYAKPTFKGMPYSTIDVEEKNVHQYGGGISIQRGNLTVGGSVNVVNTSDEIGRHFNIGGRSLAKGVSWDFGVGYNFGPLETSMSMIQSRANSFFEKGKKDVYTLGLLAVRYHITKGLSVYGEGGYINFNSARQDDDYSNDSPLFTMGVTVRF